MANSSPLFDHINKTRELARELKFGQIYDWLVDHGYFPESYVLPPSFRVCARPKSRAAHYPVRNKKLNLKPHELCSVHFPKTELTDRDFGLIEPRIHSDICVHIARNWKSVVDCLIPKQSEVACFSFPLPIDSSAPGRLTHLRSGRMIYEYLWMCDDALVAMAYQYSHVVRADIKRFYPSIYTHSLAWAFHGKKKIRKKNNRTDMSLIGNRLDKLFQYANDQRTNGIPIGPVVSDIAAEAVAAAVDVELTRAVQGSSVDCAMARFKDDYRILVKSKADGERVIKLLQAALRTYSLELSDEKTEISGLPDGLFRPWVSAYHAVHPQKRSRYSWKEFRELYLAVLEIDRKYPGTGVIDRFLADIVSDKGYPKIQLTDRNLIKTLSMLLLLGRRRIKSFPKIIVIIESIYRHPFNRYKADGILDHLLDYLSLLANDIDRNRYLVAWIAYFFTSNGLKGRLKSIPPPNDPVARSVLVNQNRVFDKSPGFKLYEGAVAVGKRTSLLEHLDVFDPPGQPQEADS